METKWLEDFLCLAELRSFSRAAAVRHVTQPAFSRRIRALETWLGAELIDRATYPTRLTPAGEVFHEQAGEILRTILDVRGAVQGGERPAEDGVQFAVPHTLSLTFFPKWLAEIEALTGGLATRLVAANVHDAVTALVEGNCDLVLCYHHAAQPVQLDRARYPMLVLGVERLQPYSRAGAQGEPRFRLPGSASRPVPFLAYSANAYLGRMVETVLRSAPRPAHLRRRYETDMAEALKAMVLEGHGVAWLPESAVQRETRRRQLVSAVDPSDLRSWSGEMEIRLYRDSERRRPVVDRIWGAVESLVGHAKKA
ncbi:MAG: LysR family transcriptional regulator [Betaproteobacteria bacterium]|nr:LysR family transcriptional regulator [Betaproteobacteria bacterium]